jgi:hypothetical protein
MRLRSALTLILLVACPGAPALAADPGDPANPFAAATERAGGLFSSAVRPAASPFAAPVGPAEDPFAGALEPAANPFAQASEAATGEHPQPRYGFSGTLGWGGLAGNFGKLLRYPISGDFNFFHAKGRWRYGLGLNFTSMTMEEPWDEELEWGYQRTYLFATRMFRTEHAVQPYVQVRGGLARLHPRSELFAFEPPPEEPGDSPTTPSNGWSFGVVPGVEIRLTDSLALDLSGHVDWFHVSEYDLSPVGVPNASAGTMWQARLGVRWYPDDGWPSGSAKAGHPDRERDAWGVSKNWGWAIGEALAINLGASGLNEYTRNANFNQISPRSWWTNLETGFTYDDNEFKTNQLIHPFNGSTYYNAGRANGLGFWESSLVALGGAFFWECCGETHPMSFNDMISTGIGGVAFGEAVYRLSGQLLDNTATGRGRRWREIGAFAIDPVRGFNRALSGRWGAHPNPENPLDWRPDERGFFVYVGARVIGEGDSITENTKSYGVVAFDHFFGSVFDNQRRKPFDSFNVTAQFSFGGEKNTLTIWRLRGDLFSRALGTQVGSDPKYAFAVVQHFDYYNNNAYEFGQQALGPTLFARYRLTDKLGLRLRLDGMVTILGAVNSEYAALADVANRERFREYDYGPGLGFNGEASLLRKGSQLLSFAYRYQWIKVSNGSVFNEGNEFVSEGSDADHYLQAAALRLVIPVARRINLGADGLYFLRRSRYYAEEFRVDKRQRNPEVRLYLAFNL